MSMAQTYTKLQGRFIQNSSTLKTILNEQIKLCPNHKTKYFIAKINLKNKEIMINMEEPYNEKTMYTYMLIIHIN